MKSQKMSGREIEVEKIRNANRAAAVGKLLLGEISDWAEFLNADTDKLELLPRRQLKFAIADIKKRLSGEIRKFSARNFENLTEKNLSELYEEIKSHKGTEIPLKDFERKYSKFKPHVLLSIPPHATVMISLWGLKFKFPEDYLAKDLYESLSAVISVSEEIHKYNKATHWRLLADKENINSINRKEGLSARSTVLCCFNLVEAYLNGLAWNFAKDHEKFSSLSNRQKKLIKDIGQTSIRDKIIKYPNIVTGRHLWDEKDAVVSALLETIKPFRDSLVHPSPFSAPEKFGGYDKLSKFYRIDHNIAIVTATITTMLIKKIHIHVNNSKESLPGWMKDIEELLDEVVEVTDKDQVSV